jgi:hypothetical protein
MFINASKMKMGGGSLRWRGPRGFGRIIYFGDFRDVGCVSSFFGMFEKKNEPV